jgi:hypothetical protein
MPTSCSAHRFLHSLHESTFSTSQMLQWDPNDPYHAEELEKVVLLQLSKNLHLNADMFCQVSKKSSKKSMRERRLDKKVLVF